MLSAISELASLTKGELSLYVVICEENLKLKYAGCVLIQCSLESWAGTYLEIYYALQTFYVSQVLGP